MRGRWLSLVLVLGLLMGRPGQVASQAAGGGAPARAPAPGQPDPAASKRLGRKYPAVVTPQRSEPRQVPPAQQRTQQNAGSGAAMGTESAERQPPLGAGLP